VDETRAEEILVPLCDDGPDLLSTLWCVFFCEGAGLDIPPPYWLRARGFDCCWEEVINKGRPIHAGNVTGDIGLDRKRIHDVVPNGFR